MWVLPFDMAAALMYAMSDDRVRAAAFRFELSTQPRKEGMAMAATMPRRTSVMSSSTMEKPAARRQRPRPVGRHPEAPCQAGPPF